MLTFNVSLSGSQVADAVFNDDEELLYFLIEFKDQMDGDKLRDVLELGHTGLPVMLAEVFEACAKTCREYDHD